MSGNGPLNIQVAAELVRAGVTVVALAELSHLTSLTNMVNALRMTTADPGLAWDGAGYVRTLVRARVPILLGSSVVSAAGDGRVEQAMVMRIDASGFPIDGTERTFEVDTICAGFGFLPSTRSPAPWAVSMPSTPSAGIWSPRSTRQDGARSKPFGSSATGPG